MSTTDMPPDWQSQILTDLHVPNTGNNQHNLTIWNHQEGGTARYNPFNTTLPMPGATDYNSVHVKNYPDWPTGKHANVQTINQQNMHAIKNALANDVPEYTFKVAVNSSPWGTHFPVGAPPPTTTTIGDSSVPADDPYQPDNVYQSDVKDSPGKLNAPISCAATTNNGLGYWLVAKDGGVFAFGNAVMHGSLPNDKIEPNGEIVAILPSETDDGYLLIGSDGGVFAYGDARGLGTLT